MRAMDFFLQENGFLPHIILHPHPQNTKKGVKKRLRALKINRRLPPPI
jgi:hypothetical protein